MQGTLLLGAQASNVIRLVSTPLPSPKDRKVEEKETKEAGYEKWLRIFKD